MSPGAEPGAVIAGVLDTLRQSRTQLLDPNPQNVDWCRIAISQSVFKVVDIMQGDRSQWKKAELTELLLQIRSELSGISRLLDSAAVFRRDRLRGVSEKNPSPVAAFDTEPLETVRRVHVLG